MLFLVSIFQLISNYWLWEESIARNIFFEANPNPYNVNEVNTVLLEINDASFQFFTNNIILFIKFRKSQNLSLKKFDLTEILNLFISLVLKIITNYGVFSLFLIHIY